MFKKLISYLILSFCFICNLTAYHIKKVDLKDGLSNSYIVSMTQDKRGFLWFATESGLNRFDGYKFRVYKSDFNEDENSISGNELNRIYADKKDNIIWIATQRKGLNAFDYSTEKFTHYKHDPDNNKSITSNDITDIRNAADGNLWISSYHNGFDYFDKEKKEFIHYNKSTLPNLISNKIWTVNDNNKGVLFIGHVDKGLSVLSLKENKVENYRNIPGDISSLPGDCVRVIFIDKEDNIWIGTNNGVALFNYKEQNFTVFKHSPYNKESISANYIYDITQTNDGRLLFATEIGGVNILNLKQNMFNDPKNINFEHLKYSDTSSGLSNNTVRSIIKDSYNNIWIGTYGGGINIISSISPSFNSWEYSPIKENKNRLTNKVAWGMTADSEDNIWVGTDGGGINIFTNNKLVKVLTKESYNLSENAILSAFKDSKNNLWFGTYSNGVNKYCHKEKRMIKVLLGDQPNMDVRCFYEDDNLTLWIGTNHGLYSYHLESKEIKLYNESNHGLAENLVRSITKDYNGNLWVGTFGKGITIFNSKMEVIHKFDVHNGLQSNTIEYIYKDTKSQIWVATGKGLVLFPDSNKLNQFKIFTTQDGLIDNTIRAITEDSEGSIWISSNGGISRYIPSLNKFYNYNESHGVPIGSFMSGSITKNANGDIFFGSQNGVCYFTPSSLPTHINLSPIAITQFTVYNPQIMTDEKETILPITPNIRLSHKQSTFNISFSTQNYAQTDIVEYAYKLKGLDENWHNTLNDNSVTFRNISHGKYQFLLRARIKNQDWSEEITSIHILIQPPIWLTWWAKTIYGFIFILTLIGIIRFYTRRINLEATLLLE